MNSGEEIIIKSEITIRGRVYVPKDAYNLTPDYKSGIRPNAMTLDGLVASVLILDDPTLEISEEPIDATLCFFYPVVIDLSANEIGLYAGSSLLMRFMLNKLK